MVQLFLFDMSGNRVKGLTLPTEPGWNTVRMDTSDLPAGTYIMTQITSTGKKSTSKIIVYR